MIITLKNINLSIFLSSFFEIYLIDGKGLIWEKLYLVSKYVNKMSNNTLKVIKTNVQILFYFLL